ncbi:hypothetical protein F4777DRAFT_555411 [Nemania sp. FL0916]|nr:hypothetical protein F4777DRAFT_555411 [Nemania sp. FL0916]
MRRPVRRCLYFELTVVQWVATCKCCQHHHQPRYNALEDDPKFRSYALSRSSISDPDKSYSASLHGVVRITEWVLLRPIRASIGISE